MNRGYVNALNVRLLIAVIKKIDTVLSSQKITIVLPNLCGVLFEGTSISDSMGSSLIHNTNIMIQE